MLDRCWLVLLALVTVACQIARAPRDAGDGVVYTTSPGDATDDGERATDGTSDDADGDSGVAYDQPPHWSDAPKAAVAVGEGRTVALALTLDDPDGGTVTATATAPSGLDAEIEDGELRIHAGYGATPASVIVELTDDEGDTAEIAVAIDIPRIAWVGYDSWGTGSGPEEREHGTVVFDRDANSAFLFGGSGYHPQTTQLMDDFWRYDVASGTWSAIVPTGDVPPGAGSRRFAGQWGAGTGYIFGGYGTTDNNDDLYRVSIDGQTLHFELVAQSGTTPAARLLHGFAYDPETDRYFLFGGAGAYLFGDTWQLEIANGTPQWTELSLAPSPSPRYGFFSGFDENAGRFIVFSGAQGYDPLEPASDTWALDTRVEPPAWIQLTDPTSTPPGRRNGCAVWDPSGPRLIVFGGTADALSTLPGLHLFDARPGHEAWTTLDLPSSPPMRSSGFGFSDGRRNYLGFGNDAALYRDWGLLGDF